MCPRAPVPRIIPGPLHLVLTVRRGSLRESHPDVSSRSPKAVERQSCGPGAQGFRAQPDAAGQSPEVQDGWRGAAFGWGPKGLPSH